MIIQGYKYDDDGYFIDSIIYDNEKVTPANVTEIPPPDSLYNPQFVYGKWVGGATPPTNPSHEETELEEHIRNVDLHFRPDERQMLETLFGDSINFNGTKIDPNITALKDVTIPDCYYMTTVESSQFTDHPAPGISGWFFIVSKKGSGNGQVQVLIRYSMVLHEVLLRINSNSGSGEFGKLQFTFKPTWTNLPLSNGATSGEVTPAFVSSNGQLVFRGSIKAQSNLNNPFSTLSQSRRPTTTYKTTAHNITKNQTVGLTIEADTGRMMIRGDISTNDEISLDGIRYWTE